MESRQRLRRAVQTRTPELVSIVVALFIGGLATDAVPIPESYAAINELTGLLAALVLWWQRRAPLTVAAVTFAAGAVAPMAAGAAVGGVYVVAANYHRMIPPALIVLYAASAVTNLVLFPDPTLGLAGNLIVGGLLTLSAYGWGLAVRSRRQLLAALAERAERAEADQSARLEDARRAERTRIAAEMHDLLAHRLSMLSIQAGAIELRPDSPTEDLARAAGIVRSSAHGALDDLRTVIGLLREKDLTHPAIRAADIESLVSEFREAGMQVELRLSRPDLIPASMSHHVLRVLQEGLTNALKHAAGQPVVVRVTGRPGDDLEVEIVNPFDPKEAVPTTPGAGVGLVGLKERADMLGGSIEHGIDDTGRHRLRVLLPWPN